MSVSPGQRVAAAVVNAALMSRTTNTGTTAKINLNDLTGDSGPEIENLQLTLNNSALQTFSEQVISSNGEIDSEVAVGKQMRVVRSASGNQTASTTPFGNKSFNDGIEITLVGTSDTNTLTVVPSDEAGGAAMNGQITLKRFSMITFKYVSALSRWVEKERNGI